MINFDYIEQVYGKACSDVVSHSLNSIKFDYSKESIIFPDKAICLKPFNKIGIIGWGKAASPIVDQLISLLNEFYKIESFVISPAKPQRCDNWFKGHHPYLHIDNYYTTGELINFLNTLPYNSLLVAVSTGGGSANLWYPESFIDPLVKMEVINELICKDIDCRKLNNIRKCLSSVKAGKLISYVKSKMVLNLVVSDDIRTNGYLEAATYVASGPLVPQKTDYLQAARDLKRLGIWNKFKNNFVKGFADKTDYKNYYSGEVDSIILADNSIFTQSISNILKKDRHLVYDYPKPLQKSATEEAKNLSDFFWNLTQKINKPFFIVAGGEVLCSPNKENGNGGRIRHLICCIASLLYNKNSCLIAGMASDGNDYTKGIGGGIIYSEKTKNEKTLEYLNQCIADFNSGDFIKKYGKVMVSPNDKTNVNDAIIIANFA